MNAVWTPEPEALRAVWTRFQQENPKTRIRDAAAALGVSEAQLVALGCGEGTVRLAADWGELVTAFGTLGHVTAITRNESVVHEKHGVYAKIEVSPMHVLVLGEDIDLRLFPRSWATAFALSQPTKDGVRKSVQIFDRFGHAVHKVFSTGKSDLAAFDALIARFTAGDQSPRQAVDAAPAPERELPDWAVDADGFRAAWRDLKDTHDFFLLLRRFGVSRTQALRLAEPEMAWRVANASVREVLGAAASSGLPIMVFVGNPGAIQIHTGPVQRIQDVGPWLNVLDAGFNLHFMEKDAIESWVVRKPTVDGIVTSLEVFDARGNAIAQLFGKRKPGLPELEDWRRLAESLPRAAARAAEPQTA